MLKSKTLANSLGPEYNNVLSSMDLPAENRKMGVRPRSRSRRAFSVPKLNDDKKEESESSKKSSASSATSSSAEDDNDKKEDGDERRKKKKKSSSVSFKGGAEVIQGAGKLEDGAEKDKAAGGEAVRTKEQQPQLDKDGQQEPSTSFKSKIPAKKRIPPLQKGKTTDIPSSASKFVSRMKKSRSQDQQRQPSAYIDVTTDSIDRHRPSKLQDPATYMDVTGIDPLQPSHMGMTVEQWRAFKHSHAQDDQEYAFDDGVGHVGDDDGDW